jgi:hypothetical protein
MRYKQRENLTVQTVDDEILILDLESNQIHQLNTSASFIWSLCDGEVSMEQLAEIYAEHYEVEAETAKADVQQVTDQLCEMGLLKAA